MEGFLTKKRTGTSEGSGFFSSILDKAKAIEIPAWFNEQQYLANYPDVAAAVKSGDFVTGYRHYEEFGKNEGRTYLPRAGAIPGWFDENQYLSNNPDVAIAVLRGDFPNGYTHFMEFGQMEGRSYKTPGQQPVKQESSSEPPIVNDVKGQELIGSALQNQFNPVNTELQAASIQELSSKQSIAPAEIEVVQEVTPMPTRSHQPLVIGAIGLVVIGATVMIVEGIRKNDEPMNGF
ncbi:MAG: hypothetical protein RJQ09_05510 [Cyclobacteriaceae bacterium]